MLATAPRQHRPVSPLDRGIAGERVVMPHRDEVVGGAVRESLNDHTENLIRLEEAAGQVANEHWQQLHIRSAETLEQLKSQQAELSRHGEILTQALQATVEVVNLEKALNQNLRALAAVEDA